MAKKDKSLYENKHPNRSLKGTGYANKEKALNTIELVKNYDLIYQKQVIITMYNRAKFHKYQTANMREAMKVYKKWLKLHGIKT
jgi:hypothetical protein